MLLVVCIGGVLGCACLTGTYYFVKARCRKSRHNAATTTAPPVATPPTVIAPLLTNQNANYAGSLANAQWNSFEMEDPSIQEAA